MLKSSFANALRLPLLAAAGSAIFLSLTASAQVVLAPSSPQIGSSNPVTAEPPVSRPATKPCVVSLFTNEEFADFNNKTFSYNPPADCPGPWAKVVFTADFTVTAGRQFDRTAAFYLGHANIYYGTTAEPRSNLSPSWHVERDVTDLSAIFKTSQTGEADLGNFVGVYAGVTYNGIIYANAALEFYPAAANAPAAHAPDAVLPLPDAAGGAQALYTTSSQLTQTFAFPTNVERAYLDLITQSQSQDEFWYSCSPTNIAAELVNCPNSGFREAEIAIDGKPAGVAPVYPWIYTGGVDPFLWEPLPGVQTLDFVPYRVDLTPFAGVLSNGQQHTVAVSVFNADSYFLVTGNLLLYLDHGSGSVTGAIESDTLSAEPSPTVTENLQSPAPNTYTGTVTVSSMRNFVITGYANTSHGRVETTVEQHLNFVNTQQIDSSPTVYIQNIVQSTEVDAKTTSNAGGMISETHKNFSYPLIFNYNFSPNPDGSYSQVASIQQKLVEETMRKVNGTPTYHSKLVEQVSPSDTLNFSPSFAFTGNTGQQSVASYTFADSLGACYSRTLTAANSVLTNVQNSQNCGKANGQ